jgi:hypothetical protein
VDGVENRPEAAVDFRHHSRVDFRPVTFDPGFVTDYVMKTVKRCRVAYDQGTLILPRTLGELNPPPYDFPPSSPPRLTP